MLYPPNRSPVLPALIAEARGLPDTVLFDVGCSGGIAEELRPLGARAYGFDPLVAEIARLRSADPDSTFVEAWITGPNNEHPVDSWFERSSYWEAAENRNRDYAAEAYNCGEAIVHAERRLTLDAFCSETGVVPHVLKIDTDGHDYAVLRGATGILPGLLAVKAEVYFQAYAPGHAMFRDVDALLAGAGFLFADMHTARYTRAALPGRFTGPHCADTLTGGILWADVLYMRDAAALRGDDLLRLAMVAEVYNLPDIAAEALLQHGSVPGGLDALVRYSPFPDLPSYAALRDRFETQPDAFV